MKCQRCWRLADAAVGFHHDFHGVCVVSFGKSFLKASKVLKLPTPLCFTNAFEGNFPMHDKQPLLEQANARMRQHRQSAVAHQPPAARCVDVWELHRMRLQKLHGVFVETEKKSFYYFFGMFFNCRCMSSNERKISCTVVSSLPTRSTGMSMM